MADAYTYPTPAMQADYIAANRGGSAPRRAGTQLEVPNIPQRLTLGQRLAILIGGADAARVLFAPQQPLQPQAQAMEQGALGRRFDYPMGYNTRTTPRSGEPINFAMLKNLAKYDVLRIILEHVKEEVSAQDWTIGPQDKKA